MRTTLRIANIILMGTFFGCAQLEPRVVVKNQFGGTAKGEAHMYAQANLPYWTLTFGWKCNAPGGGFGARCEGNIDVPDSGSAQLPPDLVHCKTETMVIKRDPGHTGAGWNAYRTANDNIFFRHHIVAGSEFFGPGREIEVHYVHTAIRRSDEEALGKELNCTFTIDERIGTY
jgi:hypothetical protein